MKIGPLSISLAEKPTEEELGATGTVYSAGQIIQPDYNADLVGEKALEVYDKMRRSDGTVAAMLAACSLPIRAATWGVRSASDDAKDKEIAELVERSLFGMTITWDDFLRHALLMEVFGFYVFEKVWELDGDRVWGRKLAPRMPQTINEWRFDDTGGLASIRQLAWRKEQLGYIDIPVDKLLVFTLNREGSNYTGISLLRPAYKHWFLKDKLYRIDVMAAERHGVGIPVGSIKDAGVSATEIEKAERALRSLHAHEKGYLMEPSNRIAFRIEDMKGGTLRSIIESIQHHDVQIARSVLAEFLTVGTGDSGSWAMVRDKSSFFLLALQSIAKNIADTINRYYVQQLVDFNFEGVQDYPILEYSRLESRDATNLANAVSALLTSGGLTADPELEGTLRTELDLPAKPEPTSEMAMKERPLTAVERLVDFADIEAELDKAMGEIAKAMLGVQTRQAKRLVELVMPLIEKQDLDRLADLDVPYKKELEPILMPILERIFGRGRDDVRKELVKQGAKLQEPIASQGVVAVYNFWKARVTQAAALVANRLHSAMSAQALSQVRTGLVDKAAMSTALTSLAESTASRFGRDLANEAYGLGRTTEAVSDDIGKAVYSAILDSSTCDECAGMDGKEFTVGTAEFAENEPPYRGCAGCNNCRCMYIYLLG